MAAAQDVFAELYLQNQRKIYGFILLLLPNQAEAEDVFQQTTLLLWEKWNQFDPNENFANWACGIARNQIRNYLRLHRHGDVYLSDEVLEEMSERHMAMAEEREDRRYGALSDCLDRLPRHQRQLLERCYHGREEMKAIAQAIQLAPSALYMKLHRIRRALLNCIETTLNAEGSRSWNFWW